jgi:soluble lytic murein transglycosylase-like protein
MAQSNLRAVISAVDRMSPTLKAINTATRATRKAIVDMGRATDKLRSNLALPTGIGLAAGLFGVVAAGKKIVEVSAQFEDFSATLETVMGSTKAAASAMDWVEKFAAVTPYELDQVTKAFVAIRVLGVDPMAGALKAAGDAAAVMNRPLDEATNALASAMRGNTEMLDQFGIQAKIVKNDMVLTWTEMGKKFGATVNKMDQAAIASKVGAIWERMFGGAMEKKSKTWNGILSNLSDQWTRFIRTIGSSGTFEYLKGQAGALLEKINELEKSGTLKKWAVDISGNVVGALKGIESSIRSLDLDQIRNQLKGIAAHWQRFVDIAGGSRNILIGVGVILSAHILAPLISIAAAVVRLGYVLGALALANPVATALAIAILAIAAAGWKVYNEWDNIKDGLIRTWTDTKEGFAAMADFIERRISAMGAAISGFADSVRSGLSNLWTDPVGAIGGLFKGPGANIPELAAKMGGRYEVDPRLVQAIIKAESGGNPNAHNAKGASGLMQLMPATARRFGVTNPFDPAQNVRGGTAYLSFLLNRYGGNIVKAVAGYNAGEGAVDKYHGIPPYRETQKYVATVLGNYRQLVASGKTVDLGAYRQASAPAVVDVRFHNAPEGTRVEPQTARPGGTRVKAKVGYREWKR